MRRRPLPGIYVAAITAMVSGLSIFVNSYGVRAWSSPTVYTTAKNLVATVVLVATGAIVGARRRRGASAAGTLSSVLPSNGSATSALTGTRRALAFAYVGVVGGGLAFVLFFDGLSHSPPAAAAFWRDTLVIWVAIVAVVFTRETIRWWNVVAITLLVAGEIVMSGGVGQLAMRPGELDVLASSVLWAVEVVVAKRLLVDVDVSRLAMVRMGVGATSLIAYLAATGRLGALVTLDARQLWWVVATGALLGLYVATWLTALARARALDVTSVLLASALVTWILQGVAGTTTWARPSAGLLLIAGGSLLVIAAARRPTRRPLTEASR
jgi:drug/metabolite transporter (DMT)-like permease